MGTPEEKVTILVDGEEQEVTGREVAEGVTVLDLDLPVDTTVMVPSDSLPEPKANKK